jgi:5-methylcytosine-specific restriction endonuclease McrA
VDHYEALIYGGTHDISNVVLACPSCNTRKRDMRGDDFAIEALERASSADRKGLQRVHKKRAHFIQRVLGRRQGE